MLSPSLLAVACALRGVLASPTVARAAAHASFVAVGAPWNNPDGGNLVIQTHEQRINWGSWRPVDVVEELRKHCGGIYCKDANFELDTKVVQPDGKGVQAYKLKISTPQSSFSTKSEAQAVYLLDALHGFFDSPHFTQEEKKHWDSNSESQNCPAPATTCWSKWSCLSVLTPFTSSLRFYNLRGGGC